MEDHPAVTRRGRLVIAGVAVVVVAVAAFVVGRATSADSSSSRAPVTTTTVPTTTVPAKSLPTGNVDEIAENRPDQPLDPATRTTLGAQLVSARTAAEQYPTVATARAAGLLQAGKFAPELGAHFISYANLNRELLPGGAVDAQYPVGYIYDGVSPASKIVGLMYVSIAGGPAPAGFAGPNDHWHRHMNLCIQYGTKGKISVPFAPDRDVTLSQCNAVHGQFMPRTVWMVHAWVVPGWESPKGVFSHSDPNLRCADGTVHADAVGFCPGT